MRSNSMFEGLVHVMRPLLGVESLPLVADVDDLIILCGRTR